MSTTTENTTRPPRAPAASVVLTVMAIVTALLLAPVTSAAAAPLPAGTYDVAVGAGQVTVRVAADGAVTLSASDGLLVQLGFDEEGRVLDEFRVTTDTVTYRVEVDLADDGSYSTDVEEQRLGDVGNDHGELVSTVAQCAPTGLVAGVLGLPNHGTIVSAAASGLSFSAEVTDPVSGTTTTVDADFSSLAGAQDFCAQVDAAVPTLDEIRDTLEAEAAAARAAQANAQDVRAAARAALARAQAAERAAERATERAAEQAEREAQRAQRRAERPGGEGRPADAGTREPSDGADQGQGGGRSGTAGNAAEDPKTHADDGATDDQATDGSSTDESRSDTGTDPSDGGSSADEGSTQETTNGTSGDGSTTDDTTGDTGGETTTGPGQGGGKPSVPGANGKGPNK